MSRPHAIVIGTSSGGVSALLELAAGFPKDVEAVVGMVLHVGTPDSILPELISARGALPAFGACSLDQAQADGAEHAGHGRRTGSKRGWSR